MKGLALAEAYFNTYGKPLIEKKYGSEAHYFAAGLVGEGSECYGYDDAFSQDHDFGPGFCIWLPEPIYEKISSRLWVDYNQLPKTFKGYTRKQEMLETSGRIGVFSIDRFYHKFTHCGAYPKDNLEWFSIPEKFLATATNGAIFMDNFGAFTKARKILKSFYPDDVLRKKLAARIVTLSQSGQYNYKRMLQRKDYGGAYLSCHTFVENTLGALYLLNRQYMPFYKWAFRGTQSFSLLKETVPLLNTLITLPDNQLQGLEKIGLIETICAHLKHTLVEEGFSQVQTDFLEPHGHNIMEGIKDKRLRQLHVMADIK